MYNDDGGDNNNNNGLLSLINAAITQFYSRDISAS